MSVNLRNLLFAAGLTVTSLANVASASSPSPVPQEGAASANLPRQEVICENLSGGPASDALVSPWNLSCNGVC